MRRRHMAQALAAGSLAGPTAADASPLSPRRGIFGLIVWGLAAASYLFTALAAYAQAPAGWHSMKDRKQLCQISVPAGWTADKEKVGTLASADKSASVIFSGKPRSGSFAEVIAIAKRLFKPVKTIEESATRTWFVATPKIAGQTEWYLAVNTMPICEAEIAFKNPAFEATAKQIAGSLKSTK